MAETQNVFVTRTQNRFLPIIQAFNDNLYKHMQMQGELNDKTIAFNQKVEGEKFIGEVGNQLMKSNKMEDVVKIMGQAFTTATSRGLNEQLPFVEAIAKNQQNAIGIKQTEEEATSMRDLVLGNLGDQYVPWKNGATTINQAWKEIEANTTGDPGSKLKYLNYLQSNILERKESLLYQGENKPWLVSRGYKDKAGKYYDLEEASITSKDNKVMANWLKGQEELSPELSAQYGGLLSAKEDKKAQRDLTAAIYSDRKNDKANDVFSTMYTVTKKDGTRVFASKNKDGKLVSGTTGELLGLTDADVTSIVPVSSKSYGTFVIKNVENALPKILKGSTKLLAGDIKDTFLGGNYSNTPLVKWMKEQTTTGWDGNKSKTVSLFDAIKTGNGKIDWGKTTDMYRKMQELNKTPLDEEAGLKKGSQLSNDEKDVWAVLTVQLDKYNKAQQESGGTAIIYITPDELGSAERRVNNNEELKNQVNQTDIEVQNQSLNELGITDSTVTKKKW